MSTFSASTAVHYDLMVRPAVSVEFPGTPGKRGGRVERGLLEELVGHEVVGLVWVAGEQQVWLGAREAGKPALESGPPGTPGDRLVAVHCCRP
jgi:hypothetical protein